MHQAVFQLVKIALMVQNLQEAQIQVVLIVLRVNGLIRDIRNADRNIAEQVGHVTVTVLQALADLVLIHMQVLQAVLIAPMVHIQMAQQTQVVLIVLRVNGQVLVGHTVLRQLVEQVMLV